jgi:hypothetical protein
VALVKADLTGLSLKGFQAVGHQSRLMITFT